MTALCTTAVTSTAAAMPYSTEYQIYNHNYYQKYGKMSQNQHCRQRAEQIDGKADNCSQPSSSWNYSFEDKYNLN